ncbi:hypothetical protein [Arthrobacter sp. AQ5-05]|uniref:hypothetical protein n=1 Tax=Arthrobacter sp. AQ5-05 TaxID=2184581 RepID=UPI0012B53AAD|nr:hypothetical protein [Arthrobacter sp. AQ5-05]
MSTSIPEDPPPTPAEFEGPDPAVDPDDLTFTEDDVPETAEPFEVKNKNHPDTVRRALALPILWFLLATYAVTIGAFIASRFIPQTRSLFGTDDLTAAIAAISGLQGLAAAVVGFYFGVKQEESKR